MSNIDTLPDLDVDVTVEFGRLRLPIDSILNLTEGSLIKTEAWHAAHGRDEGPLTSVDVRLNGERFAVGEVVSIGENLGIRLLKMVKGAG